MHAVRQTDQQTEAGRQTDRQIINHKSKYVYVDTARVDTICRSTFPHAHAHVYAHTHIQTDTHIHRQTRTQTHMRTHTHTHTVVIRVRVAIADSSYWSGETLRSHITCTKNKSCNPTLLHSLLLATQHLLNYGSGPKWVVIQSVVSRPESKRLPIAVGSEFSG